MALIHPSAYFVLNLGPIQINVHGIHIMPLNISFYFYGLMYVISILIGVRYIKSYYGEDISERLLLPALLGIVIGGRLGYVFFYYGIYNLQGDILWPLKTWHGGMSFHGGFIGLVVAIFLFSYKNKLNFWDIIDKIAVVAPIGIGLGRFANFLSGHLWGIETDMPWGMLFPMADSLVRHPSQLYEMFLEGFLLFIFLYTQSKRKMPSGAISGLFLIGYSLARIFCELFREPDRHIGLLFDLLSMGQLLSLPMFLVGILLVYCSKKVNLGCRVI